MLFAVLKRNAGAAEYALASTAAIAALARLREQAFPSIEIPHFTPRTRIAGAQPAWMGQLARQASFAALFAAFVLVAAITLPAIISARTGDAASSASALRSSVGATATTSTLVEDLGVRTFVGGVPFVQQLRYYDSVSGAGTGSGPAVERFVQGAREASLVEYLQDVGSQVTLPYLNDALATKRAVDTWTAAVTEARAEQQRLAAAPSYSWQASPLVAGTNLVSTVTFYACVGNGFCGGMSNGQQVFAGAAACSSNLPFGTKFIIEGDPSGRVFTCLDRGALSATWVDVWFYDVAEGWAWQSNVGTSGTITIVE